MHSEVCNRIALDNSSVAGRNATLSSIWITPRPSLGVSDACTSLYGTVVSNQPHLCDSIGLDSNCLVSAGSAAETTVSATQRSRSSTPRQNSDDGTGRPLVCNTAILHPSTLPENVAKARRRRCSDFVDDRLSRFGLVMQHFWAHLQPRVRELHRCRRAMLGEDSLRYRTTLVTQISYAV